MSVTMRTIAEVSGVSRPVVSHILNGRAKDVRIAHTTVEKVLKTAKELGYCRNELARSVVTGKSRTIAFIAENMGLSTYTGRIQAGVLRAAAEGNYTVKVYQLTPGNQREMLRNIMEWRIAGVVFHVADSVKVSWLHDELAARKIPSALVNLTNDLSSGFGVTTDDAEGAEAATRELIRNGCRNIVCVGYDVGTDFAEYIGNRSRGYARAVADAGLEPRYLWGPGSDAECCLVLSELLRDTPAPDGLFCVNDILAMQAMQVAYQLGFALPRQLKMVGFGDFELAPYAVVPLSSVRQDFERMGFLATQRVLQALESDEDTLCRQAENVVLPTQLIVRESSTDGRIMHPEHSLMKGTES